ncbi:MAG: TIGR01777 family protein [Acidimicrobiales bacterium]|nr:TIGR01777 family protein [Acidimicrobiales bacterium]
MRVAITGASGLIGRALTTALHERGDEVVELVRPSSTGRSNPTVEWDIEAGTIDAAGLEGIDAVVHLAGEGIGERKWNPAQKARILESRTKGTQLLANALAGLAAKPKVFLSGSAMGYYGDCGDTPTDESATAGDDFLADVCVQWEAAAQPAVDAGIRTAFLRTGIVLDAGGGALGEQLPFAKLGLGGPIGGGEQWWSWISQTDQIAAILFLLDHDVAGPVNLTAPNPVQQGAFAKTLGAVLHRPAFLPTPKPAIYLKLGKELAHALLFTSARVLPTVLTDAGFTFTHSTLEPALRDILGKPDHE